MKNKTLMVAGVLSLAMTGTIGLTTVDIARAQTPTNQTVPANARQLQVPATIAADLSKDVTDEINAFIAGAPDGSTIVFPKDAKYNIEGTLLVEGKANLTIDGQGSLFQSKDALPDYPKSKVVAEYKLWSKVRRRAHWRIQDSTDITIRNMEVHGPHTNAGARGDYDSAREAQHAFDVTGAKNLTLENVDLHDLFGDGVYLSGNSERIIIRDSSIRATGRQGIAVAVARDILIENNDLTDSRRGLIDIEPYGKEWASGDIRIIGNRFGNSRLLALPMGGGGDIGMVLIANNTFSGSNGTPLVYHRSSNPDTQRGPFLFVNNVVNMTGSPATAFDFGKVNGVFVAGNQMLFPGFRGMTVVKLRNSTAVFFGNVFAGARHLISTDEATHVVARSDETGHLIEHGNAMPAWLPNLKVWSQRNKDKAAGKEVEEVEEKAAATTLKEIPGGYAVETLLEDGSRAVAVVRSGGDMSQARKLSGFGLSTEAKMAWVYAKDGKVVESYAMDEGQFSYVPGT